MASSSTGASSGSSMLKTSSSEEDLHRILDQRKRKRMLSNRESARRSRMRKQKRLDELMAQASQLAKDNNQILRSVDITTQLYLNVESENSVLRAQMAELSHRLQSLNEIIDFVNSSNIGVLGNELEFEIEDSAYQISDDDDSFMMNSWGNSLFVNQPIMAAADMNMY